MSDNGPLHSERPTPTSLTNAPTPPLDTPAVPTRPTPEQISAQIIADANAVEPPAAPTHDNAAQEPVGDLPPLQAQILTALHKADKPLFVYEINTQAGINNRQIAKANVESLVADGLVLVVPGDYKGQNNRYQIATREQARDVLPSDSTPCLPPFAALSVWCLASHSLPAVIGEFVPPTIYDNLWKRSVVIYAKIAVEAYEEAQALTTDKLALEGKLAKRQQEREALDAIITRQRQDLEAARYALVALDGDGNAPDLAQAIRDLVAARDEGMAQLRALLVEAGYEGPVLNAARNVISAAARWQRQAETSAASYRALSRRVEKSAHDQTVEVKL